MGLGIAELPTEEPLPLLRFMRGGQLHAGRYAHTLEAGTALQWCYWKEHKVTLAQGRYSGFGLYVASKLPLGQLALDSWTRTADRFRLLSPYCWRRRPAAKASSYTTCQVQCLACVANTVCQHAQAGNDAACKAACTREADSEVEM
jgi:hypothetical protein